MRDAVSSAKSAVVTAPDTAADELEYYGYTSTDSFSTDSVLRIDWRVYQIKTSKMASSTNITQYWHWCASDNLFEHQVLRDVDPVSWGVYKEPIDFHLRLEELTEVSYATASPRIVVNTKPYRDIEHRGDILAEFKRDRTKRRFLSFLRDRGVKPEEDYQVSLCCCVLFLIYCCPTPNFFSNEERLSNTPGRMRPRSSRSMMTLSKSPSTGYRTPNCVSTEFKVFRHLGPTPSQLPNSEPPTRNDWIAVSPFAPTLIGIAGTRDI